MKDECMARMLRQLIYPDMLEACRVGRLWQSSSGFIWEFPKLGVPYSGVLIMRILLFRVLY